MLHQAVPDRRKRPDRAWAIEREPELLANVADVGLEQAGIAARLKRRCETSSG